MSAFDPKRTLDGNPRGGPLSTQLNFVRLKIHLTRTGTITSLAKTHGRSRACLVNGLLNAVEYNAANDRSNARH